MKKFIGYFLQGLLYTVPIAVTIFIIYKTFNAIDNILPIEDYPGLGIVIILVGITLFGFLGSTIIARPIFSYFDRTIEKAPLIKIIYSAVKDLLSAFVGTKKSFDHPVLVKLIEHPGIEKLGFITKSDLSELGIGSNKVAVYLPHSYAWSGNLFIVSKENITPIDASSTTGMKFIISGGVTQIEQHPTGDNSEEVPTEQLTKPTH